VILLEQRRERNHVALTDIPQRPEKRIPVSSDSHVSASAAVVIEGSDAAALRRVVGHIPGTSLRRDAGAHDLHPANQTGCRSLGPVTHARGPFARHFRGPYAAFQFAGQPPLKHPRIDQNEGAIAEYKYGSTMNTREARRI
jgi:hypothetical protein